MAGLNKVILMGRLTADPELKHTNSQLPVCSFAIAVDRRFKSQDGQNTADFIDIVAWRQQAEFVSKYFSKGSMIVICGSLQTRMWEDKEGHKRKSVEVVADEITFGESKKDGVGTYNASNASQSPKSNASAPAFVEATGFDTTNGGGFVELSDDDELPF